MAFTAPIFLTALAALAVPLVLHLMHRQMPRKLVFPSIRFIFKGREPHQGRRGLREILTLLARLIVLAGVVLLFAEPYWRAETGGPGGGDRKAGEVVLFFDLSASLHAADFEALAKRGAREVLARHPGARLALVASSNKTETRLPLGSSETLVKQTAAKLRPTVFRGDHQAALTEAQGLFSDVEGVPRHLVVVTDLQSADWSSVDLGGFNQLAEVQFITPEKEWVHNVGILRVLAESHVRGETRTLESTVRLRNFGLAPAAVELTVTAGSRSASRRVTLRSGTTETYVVRLENPESQIAVVSITPDRYVLDDTYHLWIGPRPPVRTGIVAARDGAKQLEAFFLRKALVVKQAGFESYEVKLLVPDFMLTQGVRPFQALFVLDAIKDYSEIEMQSLAAWVKDGGCLVYFAGRQAADCLRNLATAKLADSRFLGFQGDLDQLDSTSLRSLAPGAAAVSVFADEPSDLFTFPIYRYCRIKPPADVQPLLTLRDGDPFLIQENRERGSVFVFAANLSPAWSDLPTSMSFVPLIRQILEARVAADHGIVKLEPGENVETKLAEFGLQPANPVPIEPGVTVIDSMPAEINITRAESDPGRLDEVQAVGRLLSRDAGFGRAPAAAGVQPEPINGLLAWVLLAFLFLEIVLANFEPRGKPVR